MGTMRIFIFCGLIFSLLGFSAANAQMPQRVTGQSAQQAYYQPLTQDQYQQHVQAAYDDRFAAPPRHHVTPSIQQRASRLLQRQRTEEELDRELNQFLAAPFPAGDRSKNIGFRRLQQGQSNGKKQDQDPFGEDQVPKKDDQIAPFAEPPADDPKPEIKVPEKKPGDEPKIETPEKKPQDEQDDQQKPPEDPFKDPVKPVPRIDPQFPRERKPEDQTPGQQPPYSDQATKPSDGAISYHPGPPLKEAYTLPTDVHWPQPAVNYPPIVQRNQSVPYQIPQQMYRPQPTQQPLYQPDYQPIPGLPAQPRYVVPREGPALPGVYIPPIARPKIVMTPSDQSRIVANPPVYTDVVVRSGATGCVTCPTGSQPCGSNCQPCVSNCQPCVSNCQACVGTCQSCVTAGQACGNGCSNFYFSVFGGYTDLRDLDGRSGNHQMSADSGGGVGVAMGRRNGRNLRTEAEFTYRHNNLSGFVTSPMPASPPVSGELSAYGGMANAYWELIGVPTRCFKPYVGAGIGFVSIDAAIYNSVGRNIVPTGAENDSSFAYQWIAGVNYKAYRNTDLFAEYRFFKADTFNLDSSIPGLGDRYTFATDNVFLGLRWKF